MEATGQRTGESTRDENSRANDGNRYQDVKLKTEQASDYHAMVPKSHGEIPKSCTKSLPATPIVTAPHETRVSTALTSRRPAATDLRGHSYRAPRKAYPATPYPPPPARPLRGRRGGRGLGYRDSRRAKQ